MDLLSLLTGIDPATLVVTVLLVVLGPKLGKLGPVLAKLLDALKPVPGPTPGPAPTPAPIPTIPGTGRPVLDALLPLILAAARRRYSWMSDEAAVARLMADLSDPPPPATKPPADVPF